MNGVTRAYVGLGSNLGDPSQQVRNALRELDRLEHVRLVAVSSLYRSSPMGPQDQPDYINAVAGLDTSLGAHDLLDILMGIEAYYGRVRDGERWGPRTLDLDILLFGEESIDSEYLKVPHVGMAERNFVLYPLAEIAPELEVPRLGPLTDLLAACPDEGLERLDEGA